MLRFRLVLPLMLLAGCGPGPEPADPAHPALETRADSVALRVVDYHGGLDTWRRVPNLQFEFAVEQDGERRTVARHDWDRRSGRHRVWWTAADTSFAADFDLATRAGTATANGDTLAGARAEAALERAYRRFINDTYWLLMPTKLFDEGVHRTFEPDSSDARFDVIRLHFGEVGLTPGDRYWLWVERDTGRLARWAYVLEHDPEAAPTYFEWTGYEEHDTPAGRVRLATEKRGATRSIRTDRLAFGS